jgi:CRISPR-associated protein Csx17
MPVLRVKQEPDAMPTIALNGCAPVPLAHYLKALGILRLLSEQVDAEVKASWECERLVLQCSLTSDELMDFFCREYRPSPVLAPWNGGSGFFPKDNDGAIVAIETGGAPRLSLYRETIASARFLLKALGLRAKPEDKLLKASLINSCRNSFPELSLEWLDAVVVISSDGPDFPPLLGTGGNDGRLEFTNNFMQRLAEVMSPETGEPNTECMPWLRAALFAEAAPGSTAKVAIGQFFPGAAGGVNTTCGFDAPSAVNPWDFILMIEGALLFSAASVKRLEGGGCGSLVYPFCVRQAGVGYDSASGADEREARCEMWMPLWSKPTKLAELRAILSEGRAQVRGRSARTGVDFAQAAVTLGVDRGIDAFQRFGFQVRNGLAYFATPLDRAVVRRNGRADLLADIEQWHDRVRQKAGPRANPEPPAALARSLNLVERRIFDLCRDDSPRNLQLLLAALGAAERTLARNFKWTSGDYLRPLHGLDKQWLANADDGSPEFRLAQTIAGTRASLGSEILWFRQHLEPVEVCANKERSWVKWSEQPSNDVAWCGGDLTDALNAVLTRRLMRVEKSGRQGWPDWSPRPASLADISEFIDGRTNDALLGDLIWGLSLLDWTCVPEKPGTETKDDAIPSSFYALLRLCFRPASKGKEQEAIPIVPSILNRAINGQGREASILAVRRLRASGQAPLVDELPVTGGIARRTAAAMLFPISFRDFQLLERMTLKQQNT